MNKSSTLIWRLSLSISLFFLINIVQAHQPNQSGLYLQVYKHHITGRFEVSIKDFNKAMSFQLENGLTDESLTPYKEALKKYILERTACFSKSGEKYPLKITKTYPKAYGEILGDYILVEFDLEGLNKVPKALDFEFDLFFDKDPAHQGFLVIEHNWLSGTFTNESRFSLVFEKGATKQELDLSDGSIMKGFYKMIKLGIKHIWIGLDHILFLLALVLPAVITRKADESTSLVSLGENSGNTIHKLAPQIDSWWPLERFKPAFINIVKVVTFFTLAHTITLSLAALDIVVLPSKLVESVIAFSIALAAFHNIRPIFKTREWIIAFGFGLFHGFGFASVLGDYGLSGDFLTLSLLGFNAGVELGQLVIICMIFPCLFFIRKSKVFPNILVYGSIALIAIAFYWVIGRVFELDLPGDNIIMDIYTALT